jgi:ubiquitin-conjugating enzyme E2 W
MTSIASRRLRKELMEINAEGGCPVGMSRLALALVLDCNDVRPGITLVKADDFETWFFTIEVMGDSLYKVCCP